MFELIALIIFIISIAVISLMLMRKVTTLNTLPKNGDTGLREINFVAKIESKIKKFFLFFEKQIFLHKFLSWVKVLTLKLETKIDKLLHSIRKKAQKIDNEIKK